jgi:hypothetical protein
MNIPVNNGLNMKSLSVIASALLEEKKKYWAIADNKELSDEEVANAKDYLTLLGIVFAKIRIRYEFFQKSIGDPVPFDELFPSPIPTTSILVDRTLDISSLSVIASALLKEKKKFRAIADNKEVSDFEIAEAEDYLMLLDLAFGQISISYEELRKNMEGVIPFDERFPNPD